MISGAGAKGSTKTPAQKAEKKQESRHKQWWYPKRCELEGCDKVDGLLKCGGEGSALRRASIALTRGSTARDLGTSH